MTKRFINGYDKRMQKYLALLAGNFEPENLTGNKESLRDDGLKESGYHHKVKPIRQQNQREVC